MKNIIPIMLAIALTNMSCGKSKKEEPVTIEQENQNIDQPQANEPENQKREVYYESIRNGTNLKRNQKYA